MCSDALLTVCIFAVRTVVQTHLTSSTCFFWYRWLEIHVTVSEVIAIRRLSNSFLKTTAKL